MKCNIDSYIIDICRNEFSYFFKKANVVGVGLGYKTTKGIRTCEKSIVVLVKKKLPRTSLNKIDLIPYFYKNIKTDVVESGEFKFSSLTDRVRPVTGGYDIGPYNVDTKGSYGGMVADDENIYMLGNNHTLAVLNTLPLGTPIIQPSKLFGGQAPQDTVGILAKYALIQFSTPEQTVNNLVDAALARIDNINLVSPFLTFVGIPTGIKTAQLGMFLEMVCATSVIVTGEVALLGVTVKIEDQPEGIIYYINQIAVDSPSQLGDSGGLFLNERDVVGLNFATSDIYSLANPIETVLSILQVKLVIEG